MFFAPWRQPIMQPPQPVQVVRSGPSPPKYGSGTVTPRGLAFGRLEDRNVRAIKRLADPGRVRDPFQQLVRRTEDAIFDDAEHARRGVVVLRHLGFPVAQAGPRAAVPDFVLRPQHGAGVGDGPATDGAAMQDGDVPEIAHAEEAAQGERGLPEPAMQIPTAWAADSAASSGGPSPSPRRCSPSRRDAAR